VRVAISGASAVVDRCGATLAAAGHEVVPVPAAAEVRGRARRPDPGPSALAAVLEGCDALVNLATGRGVDVEGRARALVEAARAVGVRRFVQRSVSLMYADQGPDWITERSPLCVTSLTEPASMDEVAVQTFVSPCRDGVVLRMGLVLGDPGTTRSWLRAVAMRRVSREDGFAHVLHLDDIAPAVQAALQAPSGIYNVGAAPVRRGELVESCVAAAGRRALGSGVAQSWTAGWRGRELEPMTRSLRVSSSAFMGTTGWAPRREVFDASWLQAALTPPLALR
jgi:nucleoside-diphosphate-sugar epimerase